MIDTLEPVSGGESIFGEVPEIFNEAGFGEVPEIFNEAGFGTVPNFGPATPPVCPPPYLEATAGAAPVIEAGSMIAATNTGIVAAAGAEAGMAGAAGAEVAASSAIAFDCFAVLGEMAGILAL